MTAVPRLSEMVGIESALAGSLAQERWFTDKQRQIRRIRLEQTFWLRSEVPGMVVALVLVEFDAGDPATYQMVLGVRPWDRHLPSAIRPMARRLGGPEEAASAQTATPWAIYDAFLDPVLGAHFLDSLAEARSVPGDSSGQLRFRLLHPPLAVTLPQEPNRMAPQDQSQSTVLYGDDLLIKVLRRLWPGVSPEVELLEALDQAGFTGIARPLGVVEATTSKTTTSLAVAQSYLRNGTDGFSLALTSLRDLYADLLIDADGAVPLPENCAEAVERQGSSFAGTAAQIGNLTAEMHLALASLEGDPELAARPLNSGDLRLIADDLDKQTERLVELHDSRLEPLAVHANALHELAAQVAQMVPSGSAIRVHGDYHLGQLLRTDSGWYALDFEGRPTLPIKVRRRKTTPLRDLAGMLRSFDYAATVALRQQVDSAAVSAASLGPYGRAWAALARDSFMGQYLPAVGGTDLLPTDRESVELLLTSLQAAQALYEIDYELHSRPDWVAIPLEGMARLLSTVTD